MLDPYRAAVGEIRGQLALDAHLESMALGPCGFRHCERLEGRNNMDVKSGRAAVGPIGE